MPEVLQDPELRRNRKTSGSMPDSLSAGEFLKRSTALHDIVPVWCIWWQKLFKKVTREQQIMGGGGKSGVMRWQQDRTAVDLFLFLSKPALILDREIQSGEAVALTYSRQFGNVSFPRSFVFCRKRRSTPQCSAEFGLLSLSAPHWLGPRKPRLLPRPSGAFSERVGLCDAGVTLPQRYKRPCRRRGLLHEPPARGQ